MNERARLAAVIGSLVVQTAASFAGQIVGPLAPALQADLGLSSGKLALIVSAFYLGATLFLVPSGTISDRIGPRALFLAGPAIIATSLWGASRTAGFVPLLLCMFVAGIGNALSLPSTTRAIMDWFTAEGGRATAMSVKQTGVALAGMITALAIPWMVAPLGWRATVLIVGMMTLIAGAISCFVYTTGPLAPRNRRDTTVDSMLADAEPKHVRRQLLAIAAFTFCIAGVQLSFQSFFVLFLSKQMHYSLPLAGVLLAIAQGCGVAARIGWSAISDAWMAQRRRPALAAIASIALAATLGLTATTARTDFPLILALASMFGLSAIGWNGIVMVFVTESAGIERSGSAAGVNLLASYIAIFVVPPLFGSIVDLSHGFRAAFAFLGALLLATLACIVPMRERVREKATLAIGSAR